MDVYEERWSERVRWAGMNQSLSGLSSRLSGRISARGERGYELANPWNRAIPVLPRAVVAAGSTGDVVETIRCAAASGLRVCVQSTGHGAVPVGSDTLLVHTGALKECMIDASRHRARIGAGVTWDEVLAASTPHGLAPACGSAPGVGVVGYLTGGGLGPIVRSVGLSSDFVRSFELVTGDGERRRVTPSSDPDLFWGLRGGKSFLGIVTAVEIDLLPISEIYGGCLFFDSTAAAEVLASWRTWADGLPDHATTSVAVLRPPTAGPRFPSGTRVAVRYASLAESNEAEEIFTPMRQLADVLLGQVGTLPYSRIGEIHADPTTPAPVTGDSALLTELTEDSTDRIAELAAESTGPTIIELRRLGGALDRAPRDDSAFCFRSAAYSLFVSDSLTWASRQEVEARTAQVLSVVAPSSMGTLINFTSAGDPAAVRRSYDPQTLHRLSRLAQRCDPLQLFSRTLTLLMEAGSER